MVATEELGIERQGGGILVDGEIVLAQVLQR